MPAPIVKLCDLLDNLTSVAHTPNLEKKRRLIRTTEELYVPLAARTNPYLHDELRRSLDKARSHVGSADYVLRRGEPAMPKIVFSTAVIWSVCSVALGQKDAAELARLRTQMGVSESTPIRFASARMEPIEGPLRVYVSTAGDASASHEVLLSIKKINEKSDNYGSVEVVDDLSKANVILVQYELTEKRRDEVNQRMTMDPSSNSRTGSGGQIDRWISTQVRGYVIARRPEGFEILTRYERRVNVSEPHKNLSDALLSVLKRQADMRKK